MEDHNSQQKPIPERLEALRNLPKEILKSLSQEEVKTFLHDEVWPDALYDKLKDYIVEED
ncbi:hypothetical protein ACFLZG_08175 [Thermodesulfobacteriota bacterium]